MNTAILRDAAFQQLLRSHCRRWQTHMKYYPNAVLCWERYVKRTIRQLFQRAGTDRMRDRENLRKFLL
jgi:hypothetical protein